MQDKIIVGSIGVPIRVALYNALTAEDHDPTPSVTRVMVMTRPDGSRVQRDGGDVRVVDTEGETPSRKALEFLTVDGDITRRGTYWVGGYIINDDGKKWPIEPVTFEALDTL